MPHGTTLSTAPTRGQIVLQPRVTVDELAYAIRKHPETIRRYYRQGTIPGANIGGTITFAAADVADFLVGNGILNVVLADPATGR